VFDGDSVTTKLQEIQIGDGGVVLNE